MTGNKESSFWEHLEEFRWLIFRSVAVLLLFVIIAFVFMPYIYNSVVMGPTRADFFLYRYLCKLTSSFSFLPNFCDNAFNIEIININLTSQFFRHISTSFWLALLLVFPYIVFEIWRFVSPALYSSEKKSVFWAFFFGTIMFFIGAITGYSIVFPMTFRFLSSYQLSELIVNQISLDSYMDNFVMLIFIMGIVFELPLLAWLLSKLGLLDKSFFRKYRRHAIVVLLVLAAIITPSSDPFTLSVVFIPLYFLFELSRYFVKAASKTNQSESLKDTFENN